MQTEQIRVRLPRDDTKALRQISEECGVVYTALAAVFIRAAIKAVKQQGNVPLPLDFKIAGKAAAGGEQKPCHK